RYLLKNPQTRQVIETPQYFFLRVACGLANNVEEAIEFYRLISSHEYMASTPTLFNSGTLRPQMSSCYLLDSPEDDLRSIYQKYTDIALLSKFAGGIGVAYHRVRSRGSLIKGTNGHSNGIIPWLKTMDSSVAAVNQGGKRKGAACVYLESWHADIEEFLELRDNTGDEAKRTHNINLANWVPDLFMKRVETDSLWSLFDPKAIPHLTDMYGEAFEKAYEEAEAQGLAYKQVKARDLYARMMKTLAQTGNGWMTFKDASNAKANQTPFSGEPGEIIHLSNLCTEILEVTSNKETAVCNLGSVNLARHVVGGQFDFDKLAKTVKTAVKYLDRVIDINFYPIPEAETSNHRWRPVGLGVMGLQDAFFQLKLPFDSEKAKELSARIQEEIYYNALLTSCELAEKNGAHVAFPETKAAKGMLQFDLWGVTPSQPERWKTLKARIQKSGLRNSLLIAIAPTATIASIVGCYEAIEPQVSNLFKRETLSGEFMQINKYLVSDLKVLGLWTEDMRNEIKLAEGSIQEVASIPPHLKELYRTVWEVPMKALIDMAADRGAYIDQSQSLNLFMESPTIGKLSSMYMYAWKKGVKTTYYLRSRPATSIAKTTVKKSNTTQASTPEAASMIATASTVASEAPEKTYSDSEVIACSLENPEACEACQ
ncbi:MAG: ribonucleoside-diphosphate reductase subunit alpha, partial [Pseudobdellovibrionaceae bacterium]